MIYKTSMKWGLYLGIATAAGTQILTWLGLGLTNWFVLLTYILVILFVMLSIRNINNLHERKRTYGNAILSVLILILLARIIFQFYMFIYTRYVDPDWINMVAESWTKTLLESGSTAELIEQRIQGFRNAYKLVPMFTVEVVKYGIPQLVLGSIVATIYIFLSKRKPVDH